jgi:hypothetical protein
MIILSLMCAVLATWAVSPPAPSVRLSSRLSNGPNAKPETRRLRWWLMALPLTGGHRYCNRRGAGWWRWSGAGICDGH